MTFRVTLLQKPKAFGRRLCSCRLSSGAALAVLALLSGCSGSLPAGQTPQASSFPEANARRVFAEGYRHVQERYIEAIPLDGLALAGLDRLHLLAPELQVTRQGGKLVLQRSGRTIGEYSTPPGDDPAAWARLTAAVVRESGGAAVEVRDAPVETIYGTLFEGVVKRLDGYSRYTTPEQAENARAARDGFGGIGISLRSEEGRTVVAAVMPQTPADRAGIKVNDEIVAIEGGDVVGHPMQEIVNKLRGRSGTDVLISIRRSDVPQPIDVSLTRAFITPQSVHVTRDDGIAHIRISSFNRYTASKLAEQVQHLVDDRRQRLKGIILDLRGNSGGLLDQAVAVADAFLDEGIIVSTFGRHPASNSTLSATRGDVSGGLPMVVLINGRSASASEVVAASLQDWGRAVLVGSASHGKGSVQNVARMPNGGELVVTWSRMHAPSGYVLDKLGVMPSICTNAGADDVAASGPSGALERLRSGRTAISVFDAWHRYDAVDEAVARTLRQNCPARNEEPESDVLVARRLLTDAKAYSAALRPWPGAPNLYGRRQAQSAAHR